MYYVEVIMNSTNKEHKSGKIDSQNKTTKLLVTIFTIIVVSVILVGGIVLAAVYLGKGLASDTYKEYYGIVHRGDGPTTNETWIFTDTEEEFKTDDIRVIYDFITGLVAFLFERSIDGLNDCYVSTFNRTEIASLVDVRKQLISTEFEITINVTIRKTYEVTDVRINPRALTQRSQSMCLGQNIYFLRNADGISPIIHRRASAIAIAPYYNDAAEFW